MDFWTWIAWFFWAFVFFAYLMVLFSILGDLFRDSSVNGFVKAIWIIFLIFVPFLTALIYLIARGNGMAERSAKEATEVRAAQDAYIQQVAGGKSATEQIAHAAELLKSGAITQAEYDQLKAKALA